jgi:hypothetical protein
VSDATFTPFLGQQKPVFCDPYVCPGTYVPVTVPFEVLDKLLIAAIQATDQEHIRELMNLGWNEHKVIPPPSSWSEEMRKQYLQYMKLKAEMVSRTYFSNAPGAYRPWTADPICAGCDRWVWGWAGEDPGWTWKGVHSIKAKLPYGQLAPNAQIITCGMLKDQGVIETQADCVEEDAEAIEAYKRMLIKEAKKEAFGGMIAQIIGTVFVAVMSVVVSVVTAGAGVPAAGVMFSSILAIGYAAAQTGGKLTPSQIGGALADMLASLATLGVSELITTTLRMVVQVSISAYDLSVELEKQEEQKKELKQKRQEIEAKTDQLRQLLEARAALEEVQKATRELQAEIDRTNRELGLKTGSYVILSGIVIAIIALLLERRGKH